MSIPNAATPNRWELEVAELGVDPAAFFSGLPRMVDTLPARITVTRRLAHDVKIRQIIVSIDGNPFATLLYGDSVTREVEPGSRRIRAHNTLVWKTKDLDVKPGDHLTFTVANRAGWGTFWMVALLGAGPIFLDFDEVR